MARRPFRSSPGQTRAVIAAVALLAIAGLLTLRPFLPALGWGAIVAVSLWPWRERLARRWPGRTRFAIPLGMTLLVLLAFVVPVIVVVKAIADESIAVAGWAAQISAQGLPAPDFLARLPQGDHVVSWWNDNLAVPGAFGHLLHGSRSGSPISLGAGSRLLGEAAHRVLLIGFMLLTLFFLLRDGGSVARGMRIGGQRAFGASGEKVGDQIVLAIRGTVNGLVVVGFGQGLSMGMAYEISGVPHAPLLGLLTGLLSVVPFGSLVAVFAAAGLLAASGQIVWAVLIVVLGAVVIFVADHFVRPALIGGATRVPFLLVLLGIFGGIESWGLIGLVLGPALMAALILLWREWIGAQEGPLNPPRPA